MTNTALWIAQIFVAVVFALAGATKLSLPREQLAKRMHWLDVPPTTLQKRSPLECTRKDMP